MKTILTVAEKLRESEILINAINTEMSSEKARVKRRRKRENIGGKNS